MKRSFSILSILLISFLFSGCSTDKKFRKITQADYQSKMKAGWLGQMAGVGWGGPTEFKYNAMIIPEDKVPTWNDGMINQQYQDDIYVEMTFLKTLEDYGFDVSIRQAGIDFANSEYQLWHANLYGRDNLRAGIAPPYSGHPKHNAHADDIDYQIEADFSGLIAPGMPQMVIELGEKFGRIMNYGDGVYGGVFVGAMYAEAFFETNIHKIIDAGLASIPAESQYAEAVRDVVKWYKQDAKDWQKTWQLIEDKYNLNHDYRKFSCSGTNPEFNIDAKLNGAYIVMGLLYGEGDMDETIVISMRCGADSDCNPSNAAGILATSLRMENLPLKYKTNIDETTNFSFTAYNFPSLINVCNTLAKQAVVRMGGAISTSSDGKDENVIPVKAPVVPELKQCWDAEELTDDIYFTKDELAKITVIIRKPEEHVKTWQLAGPFTKGNLEAMELLDEVFAPEIDSDYEGFSILNLSDEDYSNGMIDLWKIYEKENCVAYLRAKVYSDKVQKITLEMGSDDGLKVWLNKEQIHYNNIFRGHTASSDLVSAQLNKGWNIILMKVSQGSQGWGASLVLSDENRNLLPQLTFKN